MDLFCRLVVRLVVEITLDQISEKDKPWIVHKSENSAVRRIFGGTDRHRKKSERMTRCGQFLRFGLYDNLEHELELHLTKANFCRVRWCPVCEWRKSLLWKARFYNALPDLLQGNPSARWIFLTFTVRNCDIQDLRKTIQTMHKAWNRMLQYPVFNKFLGWIRKVEITRGQDGSAHPHFHVVGMVKPSYFTSGYVKKEEWAAAWQKAMHIDYEPIVDVRAVHTRKNEDGTPVPSGIKEVLKYSVKASDMTQDPQWFLTMAEQTHRLRLIATGGLLKDVLREDEPLSDDDLIHIEDKRDEEKEELADRILTFLWSDDRSNYVLQQLRLPGLDDLKAYMRQKERLSKRMRRQKPPD